ncbi:MAG: ABC transporter permease [Clostridia bacterium]
MENKRTINDRLQGNPVTRFLGKYVKDNGATLIGLIAITLLLQLFTGDTFSFSGGLFFKQKNILNVLRQVSINANLACAMTIVIILGGIDISVGSVIALSGVVTGGLIAFNGWTIVPAVLAGVLVGVVIGAFNGFLISTTPLPPFIVTLSTMNIARGIAYVYTGGSPIRVMSDEFNFIGSGYLGSIPMPVIYSLVFILITTYILNRTKLGRHIYAVGGNREAARFAGINTRKVLFFAYTYSGLMAGISGVVLASRMFSGQPTAGDGQEMEAIAATVLGGTSMLGGQGAMGGTIIGVLIMGALSNGLNLLGINSFWQYVVKGVVILLAVYVDVLKKRTKKVKI